MYLYKLLLISAATLLSTGCDGKTPASSTPPTPPAEETIKTMAPDLPVAPAASTHLLLIDALEPAYTLYYKIPIENKDKIKSEGKDPELFKVIPWEDYAGSRQRAEQHTKSYIKVNDYEDVDTLEGLSRLLDRYPGTPFGLTWNGGIAYTYNDYQHAKRTYKAHLADPASHTKRERAADPVHPLNHIGPLLGR